MARCLRHSGDRHQMVVDFSEDVSTSRRRGTQRAIVQTSREKGNNGFIASSASTVFNYYFPMRPTFITYPVYLEISVRRDMFDSFQRENNTPSPPPGIGVSTQTTHFSKLQIRGFSPYLPIFLHFVTVSSFQSFQLASLSLYFLCYIYLFLSLSNPQHPDE